MTSYYVVDASVVAEYLLKTKLGLTIAETLDTAQLMAPELLDVEVLSVFRRAVLAKKLQEDRAQIALEDLLAWPIQRIQHKTLLLEGLCHQHHVSVYDAMYIATAHVHQFLS